MPVYRLAIAYEGTRFSGWARQPGLRTVQGEIEAALRTVLRTDVALTVAGRTDAGVHATRQVASFEWAGELPERLERSLNAILPRDVAIRGIDQAPDGFDARRWARSRSYEYLVLTAPTRDPLLEGRALWWTWPVDRGALDACADAVLGKHDFTAFTPTQTEHVHFHRVVSESRWEERGGGVLAYAITADAFMRNMIRILVGTMLEVGAGKRSVTDFSELLEGAPRDRAGETARAHGLYFTGVEFGDGPLVIESGAGA